MGIALRQRRKTQLPMAKDDTSDLLHWYALCRHFVLLS